MSGDGTWTDEAARRQALSDLMDGEVDDAAVARACQAWRGHASVRSEWHTYHVIGDVLRTPELASRGGARDAALLDAVKRRLAAEPVVVAPSASVTSDRDLAVHDATLFPTARANLLLGARGEGAVAGGAASMAVQAAPRPQRWKAPAAVAAGFMAVAGVVVVTRMSSPTPDAVMVQVPAPTVQAAAPRVPGSMSSGAALAPQGVPTLVISDQRMLRDAQLDHYLEAHRQGGHGTVAHAPGGVVRSVSTLAPDR